MNGPIVAGTDGSPTATKAVTEAIKLAKAFDQPLHIVSAYRPHDVDGSGLPAEFRGAVTPRSNVDSILEDIGSRARQAGVKAELHAVAGDAPDAILEVAERVGADLIVIGNKGIGSAKRFLLGNVPSKIVHHAPCSTQVVHTT